MVATPAYPNLLAGGITLEGEFAPFQLYSGESKISTNEGTAGATAIEQFRVISRVGGLLVPWDGTTLTGAGRAIGVAMQPIPAGATGPYLDGGTVDPLALIWPAGVTTTVARKQAFDGTGVKIQTILGSPNRIVYPT